MNDSFLFVGHSLSLLNRFSEQAFQMSCNKAELHVKTCQYCGSTFNWRKVWWRFWDELEFCSQRCKHDARSKTSQQPCAAGSVEDEF